MKQGLYVIRRRRGGLYIIRRRRGGVSISVWVNCSSDEFCCVCSSYCKVFTFRGINTSHKIRCHSVFWTLNMFICMQVFILFYSISYLLNYFVYFSLLLLVFKILLSFCSPRLWDNKGVLILILKMNPTQLGPPSEDRCPAAVSSPLY